MGRRRAFVGVAVAATLLLGSCRRAADLPAPPSSIVIVTVDTLRPDHVTSALMPSLAALAKEAVVFQNAFTVAPLTLPAHASLLTGAYPPRHGVRDNHIFTLPDDVPGFPSRLKQCGYATAAFVSAVVLDRRYGLNRGFDVYDDAITGPERPAVETIARAQRWIETAKGPFFVWIHLFEPHAPYLTGSYETEVTAADAALGGFFGFLRKRQMWEGLVLSVSSDHGESLGEHGEKTHGFFVYDATMRIPWIVKAPHIASRSFAPLVRIVDEMPTLIDLAGTGQPACQLADPIDGVSVASLFSRNTSPGLEAYGETFLPRDQFGWSELRSIRTEESKYIEAPQPEMYDLKTDPGERTNAIVSRQAEATRLKRVLDALTRATSAPPRRTASDPMMSERLMSLGYIGYSPSFRSSSTAVLADPKSKLEVYNRTMVALELSEAGDVAGALRELDAAERIDPDVAQVAFLKGNLFGRIDRFQDAEKALRRTVALNPQFVAARFKLALALLRSGRPDEAVIALERVVQDEPGDFRAWHNLAAVAYSRSDLDRAERFERKALAINPDYGEAWNTLGAIYILRRRPQLAVDALTRATSLSPRNPQAFRNLSLALRAAGQPERAGAAASTACTIDPRFCERTAPR